MELNENACDCYTKPFYFMPIEVSRGHKFKGKGYLVGLSGRAYPTIYAKIWDPMSKSIVLAARTFVENDLSISSKQIEVDRIAYIKFVIDDTTRHYKSKSRNPNSPEIEKIIHIRLTTKLSKEIADKVYPISCI